MPRLKPALAVLFFLFFLAATANLAQPRPVTGPVAPGDDSIDQAVQQFMDTVHAQSATAAVSRGGKLLFSRGYGWMDAAHRKPTRPDTLMRSASCSKSVTAAAIRTLIRGGKLTPDTKAFPLLALQSTTAKPGDPRLNDITIEQLLAHKGGWDRDQSFDPMFKVRQVQQDLRLRTPACPADVVRWMLAKPLDFQPGERSAYSNFGYCVLGRVIEKVTDKPYIEAVRQLVLDPAEIKDITLGHNSSKQRDPRESFYPVPDEAFDLDVMDAHGGLIASAPALCQFLENYWISGQPRKPGARGQSWLFFGSLPGTTAMVQQLPNGTNVAVLLNNRRNGFKDDNDTLKTSIDDAVAKFLSAQQQ